MVPVVECFTNYIFHLQAVARINFDSGYAERYAGTIDKDDMASLKEHGHHLNFGGVQSGDLAYPFLFLPSYIDPSSHDDIIEYYDLLVDAIAGTGIDTFLSRYDTFLTRQESWTYKGIRGYLRGLFGLIASKCQTSATILADVIKRNFTAYSLTVWPREQARLQLAGLELSVRLEEVDLIFLWEELTSLKFKFPEYRISLCSAMENGPDMNSLGYEKNLFYALQDMDSLMNIISHEVGTHLLSNCFDLWTPENNSAFYVAYESLAAYLNRRLSYSSPISFPDTPFFLATFEALGTDQGLSSPRQMLSKALDMHKESGR